MEYSIFESMICCVDDLPFVQYIVTRQQNNNSKLHKDRKKGSQNAFINSSKKKRIMQFLKEMPMLK